MSRYWVVSGFGTLAIDVRQTAPGLRTDVSHVAAEEIDTDANVGLGLVDLGVRLV
jgi:hypothetical protein